MSEIYVRLGLGLLAALALTASSIVLGVPQGVTSDLRSPDVVTGPARVVDGDTLEIQGQRVRLEGIDAPELAQTCDLASGKSWRCGHAARDWLRAQVANRSVVCKSHERDRYGRLIADCTAGQTDLNRTLVREGLAWAFVKYSRRFVREEARARSEKVGIWRGPAKPAWAFRAQRWASAEQSAPNGCAIKGNISSRGRLYHTPWSPWYSRVRINESRGERWFCTEGDAVAAGFTSAVQQ